MKRNKFRIVGNIFVGIFVLIYLACLLLVAYHFHTNLGLPNYQIVFFLLITTIIPAGFIYSLIRAYKNDSPEDLKRELELLDEIHNMESGKGVRPDTWLGKWYRAAGVFVVTFPVLAFIISKFIDSPDIELTVINYLGFFFIILFFAIMIWQDRKK